MATNRPKRLTEEQAFLIGQSMAKMDSLYDESMRMLINEEDGELAEHSTRASIHYAVGLLIRNDPGDIPKACCIMHKVLDMQLDAPEEIYHGTFLTTPQAEPPPVGNMPWKQHASGLAYYMNDVIERIGRQLALEAERSLPEGAVHADWGRLLERAADSVVPAVWRSYDPNWREFVASAFAVIVEHFANELPGDLLRRIDNAMALAVAGSVERRVSGAIPMNTNIELMHMFIVQYYGSRFGRADWMDHAELESDSFLAEFRKWGAFAEFNTSTYYGVDLTVLGLLRQYGKSERIRDMALEVEAGLWRNIGMFYHAGLENLSGPFSRGYDMDMLEHSSMGVFIYLALGSGYEKLAGLNCESSHDPIIALVGTIVPDDVRPLLLRHEGDRYARQRYLELCERNMPGDNRHVCTAAAWLGERRMIGAMSGSRNTNGQLHPATVHWLDRNGDKYYMRLLRRERGSSWNSHMQGVIFNARVAEDKLVVTVDIESERELEIYFEIKGPELGGARLEAETWRLPGMECRMAADAPAPTIAAADHRLEIIYLHRGGHERRGEMSFDMQFLSV